MPDILPVLPLKDTVVLPTVASPLLVGQPRSVRLIDDVTRTHQLVGLTLQKDPGQTLAGPDDVLEVGTLARVQQRRKAADDNLLVVVQGLERIRFVDFVRTDPYLMARVERWPDSDEADTESEALARSCRALFRELVELSAEIPDEASTISDALSSHRHLAYFVASTTPLPSMTRQEILELSPVGAKLRRLVELLQRELEVRRLEQKISTETREKLTEQQRKYLLRERMRAIQKELGEEGPEEELAELRRRVAEAKLPPEARKETERELGRLERLPEISPEHGMIRSWIDWVLQLPWGRLVGGPIDIGRSREVLDADHYDLEKVKERLLEYLAVKKLRAERKTAIGRSGAGEAEHAPVAGPVPLTPADEAMREPILCFVGPPGVGKTSLGQSIARAMERPFIRMSLGGIHDESEIRGHRRTYIGAMPGRIVQALRRAEAANPVFMLDEVDKLGVGFHGDPAAALLEVLDPAQNHAFVDTYLNVPFDLSQVLFICTANTVETIPPPLLDRMELIALSGYTEEEKLHIARRYLLPRQRKANGLLEHELEVDDGAIRRIIREYTREAGVRGLERELASVARKAARKIGEGEPGPIRVGPGDVEAFLGKPRVFDEVAERVDRPGVATGLAWTPTGGDLLFVEAAIMPTRQEELVLTGMLGDVMRESARAALTYLRSNATRFGLDPRWFDRKSVHVHVPAGAIPKDGPSAGIPLFVALASMATGIPVRQKVAMTGEITLRGKVLPVGGIKEKVLAAHRSGVDTVLLPRRNEKDLDDVPAEVRQKLRFVLLDSADDALAEALERRPPRPTPPQPAPPHLV